MVKKIKTIGPAIYAPAVIIAILVIIGIVGYSIKDTDTPVRVLIKSKAGNVKFTHRLHNDDYEIECDVCHHENDDDVMRCRNCHSIGSDDNTGCQERIHKNCIGGSCFDCHREEGREKNEWDCKFCH